MKRLLIAIVIYIALFSSMSITAYAASGSVHKSFRTELMKGTFREDGVVADEPEDEHTDELEDEEELLAVEEEPDVDDEGQDLPINEEPLIPANPEKPEIDQIEIEEKEYEAEVQNAE